MMAEKSPCTVPVDILTLCDIMMAEPLMATAMPAMNSRPTRS